MTDVNHEREQGEGLWNKISSINSIKCPGCGHDNPLKTKNCEKCNAILPIEEDEEEMVNAVVGEVSVAAGGLTKVLLKDAKNLNDLRAACEGVESGTMSADEYRPIVKKVHSLAQSGVKLLSSDVVKKKLEALPEEDVKLVTDLHREGARFYEGLSIMMKYLDTNDVAHAREGFNLVEDALIKMDSIQDRAIDMAASKA